MIETLTFKPAEDRWGLRSVAKTILDGYKDITKSEILATSADLGATLKYSFSKYFRVTAGVYNGAGYSHAENDQFKKLQLQAQVTPGWPASRWSAITTMNGKLPMAALPEVTEPRPPRPTSSTPFSRGSGTWSSALNGSPTRLISTRRAAKKYDTGGWSVFGRYTLKPDKVTAFARYDSYVPNS